MLYLIIVTGSCTFLNRVKLFLYYINMQILTEESNMQIKKNADVFDFYKNSTRSMGRKREGWDNAVAESFFKSLKTNCFAAVN
ncbi:MULTISPECIES: hypothetical protein [Flavobacterium]|jgi:hypothetical protein|uniref:Uncharacterized protein n=2 Tax=Flavobacterium TaxID=237 RepID=A0A1S1JC36_9FLAO|nr:MULTISPECIES: hypothetical protein [Flavobacterium]MCC9020492.1 hypothetical protein [Flavobacterium sp. F-126]MDL2145470.1 hypothetical protein [Flavobacterium tructae]OHT47079.1 hypothetical protein BHE19_21855 [Flavobacterium tructae]OXB15734.1 hypothetical protein B0A71_20135 [Flavobacterium tructae]